MSTCITMVIQMRARQPRRVVNCSSRHAIEILAKAEAGMLVRYTPNR